MNRLVNGHLVTVSVAMVHEDVARIRQWDGWLIQPGSRGEELWDTLGDWIIATLGWKNLPVIFCMIGLFAMYGGMILGDIEYHKGLAPNQP